MLKAKQMFLKCFYKTNLNVVVILAPVRKFLYAKYVQFLLTFTKWNLTKESVPSELLSLIFLDKPYQETNFKSHLISVLLCKYGKILSDLHMSSVLTFAMKLKSANYKSHRKMLVFCDQWKMISDLNMSHGKMSDFVSLPLFGFTLVIKLRNFSFESH